MGVKVELLNFSQHPIREESLDTIRRLTGAELVETLEVAFQVDEDASLAGEVTDVVDRLGAYDLSSLNLVVVLPGLAVAAACLLAELHGRLGHFPAIVRLQRMAGPVVIYEVVVGLPPFGGHPDGRDFPGRRGWHPWVRRGRRIPRSTAGRRRGW